jgi:DNA-binding SARP family transcriptional activator
LLHVSLFGGLQIDLEGTSGQKKLTHTPQALLVYLLLFRYKTHSRDVLANTFWRDYPQDRARNCLNTALWRLRGFLEPKGVPTGTYLLSSPAGELGINPRCAYWLDVDIFEKQILDLPSNPSETIRGEDVSNLEAVLPLYRGDLLEGYYYDWMLRERERLRGCYLDCLYYLMFYFTAQVKTAKAISYGQDILANDPLREDVHRHLIRLFMKNGQRCLAVKQYHQCRQVLASELRVAPMKETQNLYQQITGCDFPLDEQQTVPVEMQQTLEKLHRAVQGTSRTRRRLQPALE